MGFFWVKVLVLFAIIQPGVLFANVLPNSSFRIVVIIALLVTIIHKRHISYDFKENKYAIGVAATHILSTIPIMYIPIFVDAMDIWLKRIVVFFIIVKMTEKFKQVKNLVLTIIIGINVIAFYALNIILFKPWLMVKGRISAYGEYSGANDLALIMVIGLALCFIVYEESKRPVLKFFLISEILLFVLIIMNTISRGGFIGMSTVLCLSILLSDTLERFKILKRLSVIVFMVLLAGLFIGKLELRGDVVGKGDKSVSNRIIALHGGLIMILKNPLLGVGNNQFTENIKEYGGTSYAIAAHNTMLNVAAETGFPGLICYLGFLFTPMIRLKKYIKKKRKNPEAYLQYIYAKGILIALVGFLVCTTFSTKAHEWLLYILIAVSTYFHPTNSEDEFGKRNC